MKGYAKMKITNEFPEDVENDLLKSGILTEDAHKLGWYSISQPTKDKLKELLGFAPKDVSSINCILTFPYYNRDKELIYNRVRLYPPMEDIKYLSPKGKSPHLYIYPEDWEKLESPKTKIIVVEGEKKCLKLKLELSQPYEFNYIVIGISGVTCWNCPEWENIDLIGRDIYLAFDADSEDNKDVRREEIKLYTFLKNKGAKLKSLIWKREKGKGIDDYLVSSSQAKKGLQKLIQQAANTFQKYADRPYTEVINNLKKVGTNARVHKVLAEEVKQYIREAKTLRITSIEKDIYSDEIKQHFSKAQADLLLELLKGLQQEGVTSYFCNETKEICARMKIGEHWETHPVKSRYFRRFVQRNFLKSYNKAINNDALNTALSNLEAALPYDIKEKELNLRVAHKNDIVFYDLCNKDWEVVKVTSQGWGIIKESPIFFKRLPHQKPQVIPNKNGNVKILFEFLNLKDEDVWILTVVWLIVSFIPDIPHPILILYGSQGSAKSFFFKLLREIINPSIIPLLSLSKDKTELIQQISHHYFIPYDNITSLPEWASDIFCRAVTGEGNTKRRLYSDDEDIIYSYRRCVGLNGINCVAMKPDLLDRSILIELQRIPLKKRREEKKLWKEFNQVKPLILGGIFNTLSKALSIYPNVSLNSLPRMADFAHYGYAVADALGIGGNKFLQVYYDNIKTQNEQVIEGNPLASCLMEFMKDKLNWEGTASELLKELNTLAEKLYITTSKGWAKIPQSLVRKLNTLKINLEETGIIFNKGWRGNDKVIHITRKEGENIVDIVGSVGNETKDSDFITNDTPTIPTMNNNTVGNSVGKKAISV